MNGVVILQDPTAAQFQAREIFKDECSWIQYVDNSKYYTDLSQHSFAENWFYYTWNLLDSLRP